MKTRYFTKLRILYYLFGLLGSGCPMLLHAQQHIMINMALIDGIQINAENILGYQVHSSFSQQVEVKGSIRYKGSGLSLSYLFDCPLRAGENSFNTSTAHPKWQFSSPALQELFLNYRILPEGTYEYCVTITPKNATPETQGVTFDECLYHRSDDMFLINLIDPEDKAKIMEYYPVLSWAANYTFSNELTYRLRVAEIKQGQNPQNAIMRNQPLLDEKNLTQNSMVYPTYAKPLKSQQPYAWTVDAYYKGILLGGAETWQFIILDDSVVTKYPANRSYIDIRRENGTSMLYIKGEMKLKYLLDKKSSDILTLELINDKMESVALTPQTLKAVYGDNRYVLNLKDACSLTHLKEYTLIIKSGSGEKYSILFKYLNTDFE